VGGIDYLNALPLTAYLPLEGDPPFALWNHFPSELARRLRQGLLDVALVPAVEYLARPDYRVIPGICISSYGAVESIRLYIARPVRDVRRVALDPKSRTSALLTRLLFREVWGTEPEWVELPGNAEGIVSRGARVPGAPEERPEERDVDAVLLIGDLALSLPPGPGWEVRDLGLEWTRWTGLPSVFAFWVARGEIASGGAAEKIVERFERGKRLGLARVDEIVRERSLPSGFDAEAGRRYLTRAIQYDLGAVQIEGCLRFYDLLHKARLIPEAPRRLDFLWVCIYYSLILKELRYRNTPFDDRLSSAAGKGD
jgi:chorismate dehydratase